MADIVRDCLEAHRQWDFLESRIGDAANHIPFIPDCCMPVRLDFDLLREVDKFKSANDSHREFILTGLSDKYTYDDFQGLLDWIAYVLHKLQFEDNTEHCDTEIRPWIDTTYEILSYLY